MSWRKHFTAYQGQDPNAAKPSSASRFQSWLPEVYSGQPNRVERYAQYDQMDMDSEVNAALDIISEFSTQLDETTNLPFRFHFKEDATESEIKILEQTLNQWCNLNDWDRKIFKTFRNIIKYGDQFFIRDPETWELYYVNPVDVIKVIINEAKGKSPEQYIIKNIDLNMRDKTVSQPVQYGQTYGTVNTMMRGQAVDRGAAGAGSGNYQSGFGNIQEYTVDASHIVHSALTEGMDSDFPFGNSILDPIFKTYKQKELLEDAIIIYRVQRAPERRVFYIDVGNMPANKAMSFVERVKNEIHQKRIPSRTGGGTTIMDAAYNPLCLSMDTEIPLLDGRVLTIQQLSEEYHNGVENWTYSCDPVTGKIVPGNITWAGVTRKNAQVIKLHLDDGSTVTLTPDHKIPVLGKGFVEAQYLNKNDSLISFRTKETELSPGLSDDTYTQIYDHEKNDWIYAHHMVGAFFRDINKHQEFTYLTENVGAYKNIIHHKDFNRYNNDPRNLQWMNKEDHVQYHSDQNILVNFDNHANNKSVNQLKNKSNFKIQVSKLARQIVNNTTRHFNYKNWIDFKRKNKEFNHRVVEIEWLDEKIDTGTITIDGQERWHNYHTFPVNNSIFVKNSIMEDYFFAQTADGRGSKVEVLPGGTNLGEIDDLRYFTNKMLRALRVPSSYLPTGPEDGTATYVDGRVGTAFVQEYRFNQYCQRLQNIVSPTFDKEFKLFMKNKGINIDSGIFDLKFVEPQSFSQYKEIEIHTARANVFSSLEGVNYLSRRFILKKYLGLTDSEIIENETMWEEENSSASRTSSATAPDLSSIGVRSFDSDIGVDNDIETPDTGDIEGSSPISGEESQPVGDQERAQ